jgi:hypothetical protein
LHDELQHTAECYDSEFLEPAGINIAIIPLGEAEFKQAKIIFSKSRCTDIYGNGLETQQTRSTLKIRNK